MICKCGWKYDANDADSCPMCGQPAEYKTGIGLHNHSEDKRLDRKFKRPKNTKPVKKISERRKQRLNRGGGEFPVFEKIWQVRRHRCQNEDCKADLKEPPMIHYFAHINSKGARPDLRLNPANIVLLCLECEHKSQQQGFDSLALPEPYRSMRDCPPKFTTKH